MLVRDEGTAPAAGAGGEGLLLWALRRCALGCGEPRVVEAVLCEACGSEAGRLAHVGLRAFLAVLTLYGRRRLRLGPPGHGGATTDERALLALFAAAGAGAAEEVEARLVWLLRPTPAVDARRIVEAVGAALGRRGSDPAPASDLRRPPCGVHAFSSGG